MEIPVTSIVSANRKTRMVGMLEFQVGEDGKAHPPDLHCPNGHRIPWEYAFHEAGYPRCPHKGGNGASDCNARLYIQFFARHGSKKSPPFMLIADIDYDELRYVTDHRLDVGEIITFLGITWSPPRAA